MIRYNTLTGSYGASLPNRLLQHGGRDWFWRSGPVSEALAMHTMGIRVYALSKGLGRRT